MRQLVFFVRGAVLGCGRRSVDKHISFLADEVPGVLTREDVEYQPLDSENQATGGIG